MAGLNKVMLIGNVGREPDVHYHENAAEGGAGIKSATFPLATSERYRDRNGEIRESTEWHNIIAWRTNADTIEKYVHKGTQVYIEGRLRTRSWTDANNVKKYQTEIEVQNIQLLSAAPKPAVPAPAAPIAATPQPQQAATVSAAESAGTDDLPF